MYAVVIGNIQRNQWPTIKACLNLCVDCTEFLVGELYSGDDTLEMGLSAFDRCLPQATEMWGTFRYELPFDFLGGTEFRDNFLSFLIL